MRTPPSPADVDKLIMTHHIRRVIRRIYFHYVSDGQGRITGRCNSIADGQVVGHALTITTTAAAPAAAGALSIGWDDGPRIGIPMAPLVARFAPLPQGGCKVASTTELAAGPILSARTGCPGLSR